MSPAYRVGGEAQPASKASGRNAATRFLNLFIGLPFPLLEVLQQADPRLRVSPNPALYVEGGIIVGGPAEAEHLAVAQLVLAGALNGIDDLGIEHVHDLDRDFRISHLFLAAAQNTEKLDIAELFRPNSTTSPVTANSRL